MGHARGEIELEGKVLVIKRIHVRYAGLDVPEDKKDALDRALTAHAESCPVARSLRGAIEITTSLADGAGPSL